MSMKLAIAKTLELPISERIELVAEMWDSIARNPENIEVSEVTLELLIKKLSEHKADSEDGSLWEKVEF